MMYRYKLLKDYQSPLSSFKAGTIKTDEEWLEIFNLKVSDLDNKTDWFEKIPIINIDSIIKSVDCVPQEDLKSIIHDVIKKIIKSLKENPEFEPKEYIKNAYFEYDKRDFKEIEIAHNACRSKIIGMLNDTIK